MRTSFIEELVSVILRVSNPCYSSELGYNLLVRELPHIFQCPGSQHRIIDKIATSNSFQLPNFNGLSEMSGWDVD